MNKWIKRAAALCLSLCLLTSAAGCGGDKTADAVIVYGLEDRPVTLDPQLASAETELLMVRNLFEGLFRLDKEGNITDGAAESHTLSEDGRTYTFTLRQAVWQDKKTPVTADDFVFGLRRAVDPTTKAPFSFLLTPIQGATEVLSGAAGLETLAVTALDERTLTITLTEPDPDFPMVLTLGVSMPCNEAFFLKCKGMYGRSLETAAANGSFTLRRWEEGSSIRLNRNKEYTGKFPAKPVAVVLATGREKQTKDPDKDLSDLLYRLNRLKDGTLDGGKINYSLGADLQSAGFSITAYEDACWAVAVNPDTPIGTADMRKALRESINRNVAATALPSYFTRADSYVPAGLTLRGETYRAAHPAAYEFPFNPDEARKTLSATAKAQKSKRLPTVTLLYADEPGMKEAASVIAQQWQQNMGLYCNMEARSRTKLLDAVTAGEYQIALIPFSAKDNTVQSFFRQFSTSDGPYAGFKDASFNATVDQMTGGKSTEELAALAAQAEEKLLDYTGLTPIFFSSSAYALSERLLDVTVRAGGRVDFSFAGKVPA
ncbi:MAG: peptide ABC transporter substrate-binding protein [Clostridiales bacterium]|nr:peptide ABC transporter substrate-binding protein [Clostridiales bacterium]